MRSQAALRGEQVHLARRLALVEAVLVSPLLIVGAALTVSIYGAIFGVPILLVAVPIWRSSRRARRTTTRMHVRRLVGASSVLAVSSALAVGSAVAVGVDDLDSLIDAVGLAAAAAWMLVAVIVPIALARSVTRPSDPHGPSLSGGIEGEPGASGT